MKKILFATYVAALIALVPAVIVGYLKKDSRDANQQKNEMVKDAPAKIDGSILHLVRTF